MSTSRTPRTSASRQADNFAIMPAVAVPAVTSRSMPSRSSAWNRVTRFVQHTRCAARNDEPLGANHSRQVGGKRIGVDVVELAAPTHANARDHRHVPAATQIRNQPRRLSASGNSDTSQIDVIPRRGHMTGPPFPRGQ